MTMDSNTSSQNMNTLVDKFDAIGPNEKEPVCDASIVIFHLDTTDRNVKNAEICQIAAWCKGKTFKVYLLPDGDFFSKATENNGFEKRGEKLFHNEEEVNAVSPKNGLEKFLDFLSVLTEKMRNVLLAAHNCSAFHRYIVVRLMKQYDLFDTFKSLVLGFIDTRNVFKNTLLEKKTDKLEELTKHYLDDNTIPQQKHAVVYVEILVSLIQAIKCTDAAMKKHVEDLGDFIRFIDLKHDFMKVAKDAKDEKNTNNKLKKIAEAGITIDMLKDAYKANVDDGISNLLQEKRDGKARVNMQPKTIKEVNNKVKELCK